MASERKKPHQGQLKLYNLSGEPNLNTRILPEIIGFVNPKNAIFR